MKKKIFAILLASTAALTVAGLAACGDDGKTDSTLRSEKIASEQAWIDAFTYPDDEDKADTWNYTYNYVVKDDSGRMESILCRVADNKLHRTDTESGVESDRWQQWKDGKRYSYSYNAETKEWETEVNEHPLERGISWSPNHYIDELDDVTDITNNFADYTYDEKQGAYVCKKEQFEDWTDCTVIVKFKNGKIVYGYAEGTSEEDGKISVEITVKDIGTTKVTLPDMADGEDDKDPVTANAPNGTYELWGLTRRDGVKYAVNLNSSATFGDGTYTAAGYSGVYTFTMQNGKLVIPDGNGGSMVYEYKDGAWIYWVESEGGGSAFVRPGATPAGYTVIQA